MVLPLINSRPAPSRRGLISAFLGAAVGLGLPGLAVAQDVEMRPGASLIPRPTEGYAPPRDLKTISDIYRRMTTPVRVNGAGPFPFVVDTGANQSVIARELVGQLGLPIGDPLPLNSVAGVTLTPTARASLGVGQQTSDEAWLCTLPAAAIGGSGMLGLDQLQGARITLDFQRQAVSINARQSLPGLGDEVSLKARRRDGQLTFVDVDLAGLPVTAFLDSGAQDTVGNMALRALAIGRYPTTLWSQIPIVSVTGQTVLCEFADLPGLRIGHLTLPTWPVAFADLHVFRLWDLTQRPAILIGVDVLTRFETVCLDYARDEVRFRLPQRA
jgi:hypothetical protein